MGKVFLFADEFTNYMDVEIGIKMIKLLDRLGYEVCIPKHVESGRTAISKGMLKVAKKVARKNVLLLKDAVSERIPLWASSLHASCHSGTSIRIWSGMI